MITSPYVALLVLTAALLPHPWLEARMMTHMFVQLPLLIAAGVVIGEQLPRALRLPHSTAVTVAAFLFVTGVVTTWMVPRALDAAVEHPLVNTAKMLSLVAAGAVGRQAWRQASPVLRTFACGNTAWMMASAGLVFLEAPARLCTSYGQAEQRQAGIALITLTIMAALLAAPYFFRPASPPGPS